MLMKISVTASIVAVGLTFFVRTSEPRRTADRVPHELLDAESANIRGGCIVESPPTNCPANNTYPAGSCWTTACSPSFGCSNTGPFIDPGPATYIASVVAPVPPATGKKDMGMITLHCNYIDECEDTGCIGDLESGFFCEILTRTGTDTVTQYSAQGENCAGMP